MAPESRLSRGGRQSAARASRRSRGTRAETDTVELLLVWCDLPPHHRPARSNASILVGPKAAVGHEVVIGASAELGAALDAFADIAGLFERALLGEVLNVR
jgi:hypothetical protein